MIGRLVEQQKTRFGGEGLGEEATALEASGEGVEGAVFGEAEAGDQVVNPEVLLPVLGEVVVAQARSHDVTDGAGEGFRDLLGEAGDADAFGDGDRARIGGGLAGGDAHEGGLAGAVTAEQADAFAFLDLEVEVVQDGRAAETDIYVEETEKGHCPEMWGRGRAEARKMTVAPFVA
jgi:hypothetical protein